ncbi:MAG: ABC transporter ATP-binding protein [Nitrososphaerota archaeon]
MVSVRAVNISKKFGDTIAVNHVNLEVKDKEFVTILGPSGCGKTTTLRIIAGLVYPDTGDVFFDDKRVTDLPPYKRRIGFVFQRVALFPHMNVYNNIAFGLKNLKYSKEEIDKKVKEVLELVHMSGFEKRMPRELSGGQAQRVEIARVLALDPEVLLFDEPLSNLDAKLRDGLKYEIRRLQRETGKTAIYVTHDQAEAFAISDRIYVMNEGTIQQVGTPIELYLNPKTSFVADFIGTTNFLKGKIIEVSPSEVKVEIESGDIIKTPPLPNINEFKVNDNVLVSIRPEDIEVVNGEREKFLNILKGKIDQSTFTGLTTRLLVLINNSLIKVDVQGPKRFEYIDKQGKEISIGFSRCILIKR